MVNANSNDGLPVKDSEIASARASLNSLRDQIKKGRVDLPALQKQVDALSDLLSRLENEHNQLEQQRRIETLYEVSRALGSSLDLQTVLDQVMDAILQLTRAERGFLVLRDDDGQLQVKAARNLDQQTLTSDQFKFSKSITNRVIDTGESICTTNAAEDPRFAGHESLMNQPLLSIMASPLRSRGRIIGAIYVDNRLVAKRFQQSECVALDALAGQAAIAIENAQLFAATDQKLAARVDELRQLRHIDLQLSETLDMDKAMQSTLDWACRLSGAVIGHMGIVEDRHIPAIHHNGIKADDTQPFYLDKLYPQSVEVAATGETAMLYDSARKQGVLIVPVQRKDKVFAIIVLRRSDAFTVEQKEMIERVVARAAVAIENARLYAQVQAADRAKSEFVGIAAHELKVPMNIILGYTDLTLMEGGLQEQQIAFLNNVRDAVKRMGTLVSDLSDISRIESGYFQMREGRVPVDDLIPSVRDNVFTQIKARNHAYVEQIEPNLPDLYVDRYRLLQVLVNLISNACKYTPDGGTITLSARRAGDRVEFSIEDNGIGMTKESIKKLGTKFWRADDDYTRSQPGSGLGFAITSQLVKQMGSKITVESEVGVGSKFTFSVGIARD